MMKGNNFVCILNLESGSFCLITSIVYTVHAYWLHLSYSFLCLYIIIYWCTLILNIWVGNPQTVCTVTLTILFEGITRTMLKRADKSVNYRQSHQQTGGPARDRYRKINMITGENRMRYLEG